MPFLRQTHPRLPRSSSLHRQAAIALYRTLLSGVKLLTGLASQQREELQNVIRNRFKKNRYTSGTKSLQLRFTAGYQAIDLLDAARAGNEQSKIRILDLLQEVSPESKEPAVTVPPRNLAREWAKAAKKALREQSPPPAPIPNVLDRPLPLNKLSGRRHVPRLISAGGIPILRIGKPESPNLGALVRRRLLRVQKRHDHLSRLEYATQTAAAEDTWDREMQKLLGRPSRTGEEPPWTKALSESREEITRLLAVARQKNVTWTQKLQAIEDQEQALFEKEKVERRNERRAARVAAQKLEAKS